MIFIDCNNIKLEKIKEIESIILCNNLNNKVIINYNKIYKSKNININKIDNEKKYINLIKKSEIVFLSNTKNIDKVIKYNDKVFVISDLCKNNCEKYDNVTLNEFSKILRDKQKSKSKKNIIRKIFKIILFLLFLFLFFLLLLNYKKIFANNTNKKIIENKEKVDIRNENYVFVGDSITYYYDTENYFKGIPSVNTGICGYTTDDIYDRLNETVYIYNPTKIFLLIGTNDLPLKDNDYIVSKILDIVIEVKKNRPNAKIYLQSIYPVNDTDDDKINHYMVNKRDNNRIKDINSELKKICYSGNCEYINMYDLLKDKDDNLKLEYTDEGLHISEEGYNVITDKLMKIIKE